MKKHIVASCLAPLALCISGAVFAQSCTTPFAFNTPATGPTASGNTCAASGGSNQLGTLCGLFNSPENDDVYTFSVGTGYTATSVALTTTSSTFNPAMVLITGSCGGGTSCSQVADDNTTSAGGATSGETISVAGLGNGQYWLIVSGSPGSGTCGDYNLTANGNLPVKLQGFSVQ
jgi:hypothetical protein